jgi:ABC-type nitrate/sulfonate/bicarbonate transport system permease component
MNAASAFGLFCAFSFGACLGGLFGLLVGMFPATRTLVQKSNELDKTIADAKARLEDTVRR